MQIVYKAIDASGGLVSATDEFLNRYDALAKLKERGLTVLELSEQAEDARLKAPANLPQRLWGVSRDAVAFFTRQFSELTEAGMPLVEALQSLQKFSSNRYLSGASEGIVFQLRQGQRLSDAMSRYPLAFDSLYLSMVRLGETTGHLGVVLGRLADHLEQEMALRSKLRSALVYPGFIMLFSCALVYCLVAFLLPSFEPMWKNVNLDLRNYPLTLLLMRLSALTHNFWDEMIAATLIFGAFIAARSLLHTEQGGRIYDSWVIRLPFLGNFVLLAAINRVVSALATSLDSGASFLQALQLSSGVAGNRMVSQAVAQVSDEVAKGKNLATAFSQNPQIFPALMIQMIALGEQSGQLNNLLGRLSRYYQNQLDAALRSFATLLEPTAMIVVGGVVAVFVLGVLMPIMGVVSAIQIH